MRNSQDFWDKNAGRYDCFMRKDAAAYERLYELLRPVVQHKSVLELATGTGSIAKNIVSSANHIEATDASPEMIAEARRCNRSAKLHFSVQDMFHLPYADGSFDVIIVANALHIVPETMLQTIYARAKESRGRGTIHDAKAEGIIEKLDYDFSLAGKDTAMHSGLIARTIVLDRLTEGMAAFSPIYKLLDKLPAVRNISNKIITLEKE